MPEQPAKPRRRRWPLVLAIFVGVLVVAAITPFIVGRFLPKEFTGRAERTLRQPPDAVWAALRDFQKNPLAAGVCRKVEPLGVTGGLASWREDLGSSRVTVTTVEAVEPNRLVVAAVDDVVPLRMRWEYTLTPVEGGTRVAIASSGTVEDGTWHVPMFRCILHLMGGADSGPAAHLQALDNNLSQAGKQPP